MKTSFLRTFFLAGLAFILAAAVTGCRIEFEAESEVRQDGSLHRTVIYKAQEEGDKKELTERYELPSGGAWVDVPVNIFNFVKKDPALIVTAAYRAASETAPGQTGTDFKRYNAKRDRAASNAFAVKIADSLMVRDYYYEEKFTDIIDPEKVKSTLDRILDQGVKAFKIQLETRFTDAAKVEKIITEVKSRYAKLMTEYYTTMSSKQVNFKDIHDLADQMGNLFTSEATSAILTEKFPDLDNEIDRRRISESFHATENDLNTFIQNDETGLKNDMELVFGAHGFTLFHFYDFSLKLKMPGKLISHNATEVKDGVLLWNFNSEQLNQTLTAHSRVFYPERITRLLLILAVLLLIALVILFLLKTSKSTKKRKK